VISSTSSSSRTWSSRTRFEDSTQSRKGNSDIQMATRTVARAVHLFRKVDGPSSHNCTSLTTEVGQSPSFVKHVTERSGGAPTYATAHVKPSDNDYAHQLQRQFEEEDRQLRTQSQNLKAQAPSMFECGICLSEETEFMVFRFEPCGHPFCRDCVRHYVKSRIEEHRFPIVCPTCTTFKDVSQPGSKLDRIMSTLSLI
jgi:hypothetical protein